MKDSILYDLFDKKWVIKEDPERKYYSFTGGFVQVMDVLDDLFVDLAQHEFSALKEFYPMILPIKAANRFNYFSKLPSVPFLCTEITNESNNLLEIANQSKKNGNSDELVLKQELNSTRSILNPSVCYHTFLVRKDTVLHNQIEIITAKNQCARNEVIDVNPFRISQFTMRECVFIGEANIVNNYAENFFGKFCDMISEIVKPIDIAYSNDMFFGINNDYLSRFQRSSKLKKELNIDIYDENGNLIPLACLSRNLHKKNLVNSFGIKGDGFDIESACVAMGIERLAYALLCHCGLNFEEWPDSKIKNRLVCSQYT